MGDAARPGGVGVDRARERRAARAVSLEHDAERLRLAIAEVAVERSVGDVRIAARRLEAALGELAALLERERSRDQEGDDPEPDDELAVARQPGVQARYRALHRIERAESRRAPDAVTCATPATSPRAIRIWDSNARAGVTRP